MKHKRNWIIGIALSATAAFVGLQTVKAPIQNETVTETAAIDTEIPITETLAPPSGNCYYVWATKDAPELTAKLDTELKALNENAIVSVTYYGEDCVYEDGRSTFGVMETDFRIRLPVDDLSKHAEFGNWISQTMQLVTEVPREEIQGNWGYVEFWFEKTETDNLIVRVHIQKFVEEGKGKSGLELFDLFYTQP